MLHLPNVMRLYARDENGGALVEYAVIFAVLAGLTVGVMTQLGDGLGDVFTSITNVLTQTAGGIPG